MKNLGGECVFVSELDEDCRKTYIENFKNYFLKYLLMDNQIIIFSVILPKLIRVSIPDHDVLYSGFPWQDIKRF